MTWKLIQIKQKSKQAQVEDLNFNFSTDQPFINIFEKKTKIVKHLLVVTGGYPVAAKSYNQKKQLIINNKSMERFWTDIAPKLLLAVNFILYIWHIKVNCFNIFYFFQLTIISQNLVIINFIMSLFLHEGTSTHKVRKLLSRLHLVTISLQAIVVVGFWGLRVFFSKGIIDPNEVRTLEIQFLSIWIHIGPFLTMFYFIKTDRIVLQTKKRKKYFFHMCWGIPFILLQYLHWHFSGEHVYGFLKYFDWLQLVVFELSLYYLAVAIDYSLTLRHGLKITLSHMKTNKTTIEDIEIRKEQEETLKLLEINQKTRNRVRSVPHAKPKQISSPLVNLTTKNHDKKNE